MADDQRAPGLPVAITQALQRYLVQQEASVRDMWNLFEAPIELGKGFPQETAGRDAPVLPTQRTVGRDRRERAPLRQSSGAKLTVDQVLGRVVRNLDVDYRLVQENRRIFESLCAAVFRRAVAAADQRPTAVNGPARTERGLQWRRQQRQLMPPPLRPLPLQHRHHQEPTAPQNPQSVDSDPSRNPNEWREERELQPQSSAAQSHRLKPSFQQPSLQWQQQSLQPTRSPVSDQRTAAGVPAGTPPPPDDGRQRQRQNRRFPWTISLHQKRRLLQPPSQLSGQQMDQWQKQQQTRPMGQRQQNCGFPPMLPTGTRFDVPRCRQE